MKTKEELYEESLAQVTGGELYRHGSPPPHCINISSGPKPATCAAYGIRCKYYDVCNNPEKVKND